MIDRRRRALQFPEEITPVPLPPDLRPVGAKPYIIAGNIVKRMTNTPTLVTMAILIPGAAVATLRIFNDDSSAHPVSQPPADKEIGRVKSDILPGFSNGWGIEATRGITCTLDQADAIAFIYLLT